MFLFSGVRYVAGKVAGLEASSRTFDQLGIDRFPDKQVLDIIISETGRRPVKMIGDKLNNRPGNRFVNFQPSAVLASSSR